MEDTTRATLKAVARGAGAVALMVAATARIGAQYPLAPSPSIDPATLGARAVTIGGYLAARQTRRNDSTSFSIVRARLTALVTPVPFVAVRLQGDLASAGRVGADSTVAAFALTDAYASIVAPDSASWLARRRGTLVVGQFRTPFSLEYLTPFSLLQTANRSSVVDRVSPRRDIGVMGQIDVGRFARLAAALVNGEGANAPRNPDGRELAVGRLTVLPLASLAVAAKAMDQGGDHGWGYDARWVARDAIVEGEVLRRRRPAAPGRATDASGGYALVSYRVLPWLRPVLKWEQYHETVLAPASTTWTTYGVNFASRPEVLRLQVDWLVKREHPVEGRNNELLAQLVAIF